jgi:MYXO-CTERM domain-containing protein
VKDFDAWAAGTTPRWCGCATADGSAFGLLGLALLALAGYRRRPGTGS